MSPRLAFFPQRNQELLCDRFPTPEFVEQRCELVLIHEYVLTFGRSCGVLKDVAFGGSDQAAQALRPMARWADARSPGARTARGRPYICSRLQAGYRK